MSSYVEVAVWICIIGMLFVIITIPSKATEKKKDRDATVQFVCGKPMLIDKRRWDNVTV